MTQDYSIREIVLEDFSLGNDTLLCVGDTLTIGPNSLDLVDFSWSNGSNQGRIDIVESGTYILEKKILKIMKNLALLLLILSALTVKLIK